MILKDNSKVKLPDEGNEELDSAIVVEDEYEEENTEKNFFDTDKVLSALHIAAFYAVLPLYADVLSVRL